MIDLKMTFQGRIQSKKIDVLMDTGSFVTLISGKALVGLKNIKKVPNSLQKMVGIGNVPKPVLGAVLVK